MVAEAGRERNRFFDRQTAPVFTGVDVQCAAARPSVRAGKQVPFSHFDRTVDDGTRVDVGKGVALS